MKFEKTYADEGRVLAILRDVGRPIAWSAIAARLYGVPRRTVTMSQVRGVRDACRRLAARSLAFDPSQGVTGAVVPPRRGLVRFGNGPRAT